jgi:hypothetical protein
MPLQQAALHFERARSPAKLEWWQRQGYKYRMRAMGELGREGLPRAIPSGELQAMIGISAEFCSWDASNSTVRDVTVRWPFLFSQPLMGAIKPPKH